MKSRSIIQTWRRLLKFVFPILILISFVTVLLVDSFIPAIAFGDSLGAIAQIPRQEIRGVWMTTNDFDTLKNRDKVQDAVSQLRRMNFNTIYPVVWNSGYVMRQAGFESLFPSPALRAKVE